MGVSQAVRDVEAEIDAYFKALRFWQAPKDALLRAVLDWYRDAVEQVFVMTTWAMETGQPEKAQAAIEMESMIHLGVLQLLKWADGYAQVDGGDRAAIPSADDWLPLAAEAQLYVNFVDALKMAKNDLHTLKLDQLGRRNLSTTLPHFPS